MGPSFERLLDYDRWANHRWLPIVEANEGLRPIFTHILNAQAIWFRRVADPDFALPESLSAQIDANHAAWKSILPNRDYGELIQYRNLAGVPHECSFGDILTHVINHGTYHRGQLREMAPDAFLDTDYVMFALGMA
jgi:uncharacterized damage-inducible protein DinB